MCRYGNGNGSTVKAEGNRLKHLVYDRGAVLDSYVIGLCLVDYEIIGIGLRLVFCKIGVIKHD